MLRRTDDSGPTCGVPSSVEMSVPSTIAPALSHFPISLRIAGSAIRWATILRKLAYLLRYSWSATTMSRLPAPIRSETRAMPTDDCIRLDDRQRIACLGKQSIESNEYQVDEDAEHQSLRSSPPQNIY